MQLGIFAKTFVRPRFQETLSAVKIYGLDCVQFNLSCAGLPTLPDSIEPAMARDIRQELEKLSMQMAAVSGTCNLIHPCIKQRARDLSRLQVLIRACGEFGTSVVTLCSGTRDEEDMWRDHPENRSCGAWGDLTAALEQLLPVAQQAQVTLGIEPEPANVINSAVRARKLLDEMKSPWLKIIFDAANLLQPQTMTIQEKVLSDGISLLGKDIVLAHAKDITTNPGDTHVAVGHGALDYRLYLALLQGTGFNGPLILHGLSENEVADSVKFVRNLQPQLYR